MALFTRVAVSLTVLLVIAGCSTNPRGPQVTLTDYNLDRMSMVARQARIRGVNVIWINPPLATRKNGGQKKRTRKKSCAPRAKD